MINKKKLPTRENLTLEGLVPITLSKLASFYLHCNPEKNENSFIQEVLIPIGSDNSPSGDSYLEHFKFIQETDKSANLQYGPMHISCAYCLQAMTELKRNERELAWSYMADARYWCGVVLASKGLELAREQTIKATRSNTAKNAALAKLKRTKEEAFRLAKERCPKENGWQSRRQAAQVISADVLAFSIKNNESLSVNQAAITIYGWLKKMPEAVSLFPNRKTRQEKKDCELS